MGPDHTCALVSGGGVKCWGRNDDGQLGIGSTTRQNSPVDVSLGSGGRVCLFARAHAPRASDAAGGLEADMVRREISGSLLRWIVRPGMSCVFRCNLFYSAAVQSQGCAYPVTVTGKRMRPRGRGRCVPACVHIDPRSARWDFRRVAPDNPPPPLGPSYQHARPVDPPVGIFFNPMSTVGSC